jgi:TIR domain-containing protein
MKVFISWSGAKSGALAETLRSWLPDVMQVVKPWMSRSDVEAGARWNRDIDKQLEETNFDIICLTKSNCNAPWILFEAGALAKTIANSFVCPYLIDMNPSDVPNGPLTQFQAKRANDKET